MTGLELAKAIRDAQETCEIGGDIKICLNTGEDVTMMSEREARMFDGIIQKPANMEKLQAILKKIDLIL